ncbi:hypothetical protein [Nocardia africana]|uniref:Uncharacterized protein n=1 Tax=Nocardia africana TaxID=134964 RepID=A0ABW6NFE3_9NOCA
MAELIAAPSGVGHPPQSWMRAALVTHIEQRAADLGIELPIPAETLVFIVVALSNGLAIEEIAAPGVVPRRSRPVAMPHASRLSPSLEAWPRAPHVSVYASARHRHRIDRR